MQPEKWDPWERFLAIRRQVDELFASFFHELAAHADGPRPSFSPDIDVYRLEDTVIVRAALPGTLEDDVDIEIYEDAIILRGERESPLASRSPDYAYHEWHYGFFERKVPLPVRVEPGSLVAEFAEGVLEIRLETAHQREAAEESE
jgi:HSP20 family protein